MVECGGPEEDSRRRLASFCFPRLAPPPHICRGEEPAVIAAATGGHPRQGEADREPAGGGSKLGLCVGAADCGGCEQPVCGSGEGGPQLVQRGSTAGLDGLRADDLRRKGGDRGLDLPCAWHHRWVTMAAGSWPACWRANISAAGHCGWMLLFRQEGGRIGERGRSRETRESVRMKKPEMRRVTGRRKKRTAGGNKEEGVEEGRSAEGTIGDGGGEGKRAATSSFLRNRCRRRWSLRRGSFHVEEKGRGRDGARLREGRERE